MLISGLSFDSFSDYDDPAFLSNCESLGQAKANYRHSDSRVLDEINAKITTRFVLS